MWFENLTWPDFDMWQSYNPHYEYRVVARAISGGPVYFTDKAGKEIAANILPLVLSDGKLIRMDEPVRPTRRSLFENPCKSLKAMTAFAPCRKGGAIGAWNMNISSAQVEAKISPSDIEGITGTQFVVYEYYSKKASKLGKDEEMKVTLSSWDARLYSVYPLKHGFAPIGLTDKYIPVGTLKEADVSQKEASITLMESGPFKAYSEKEPVSVWVNGSQVRDGIISVSGNVITVDLPVEAGETKIVMKW